MNSQMVVGLLMLTLLAALSLYLIVHVDHELRFRWHRRVGRWMLMLGVLYLCMMFITLTLATFFVIMGGSQDPFIWFVESLNSPFSWLRRTFLECS